MKGKKPFKCLVCDATFAGRDELNNHVASVHKVKGPFDYNTCDVGFAYTVFP